MKPSRKWAIQKGAYDGVAEGLRNSHTEKEIVSLLNTAGAKRSKEENFEGAIAIYRDCLQVVKKRDFKGKIQHNLAIAYRRLGDSKKASSHCEQAIINVPDFEKAKTMYGSDQVRRLEWANRRVH